MQVVLGHQTCKQRKIDTNSKNMFGIPVVIASHTCTLGRSLGERGEICKTRSFSLYDVEISQNQSSMPLSRLSVLEGLVYRSYRGR